MLSKSRFRLQLHHLKDQTMFLSASCPASWRCLSARLKLNDCTCMREKTLVCALLCSHPIIKCPLITTVCTWCSNMQDLITLQFSDFAPRTLTEILWTWHQKPHHGQIKWNGKTYYTILQREKEREGMWVLYTDRGLVHIGLCRRNKHGKV